MLSLLPIFRATLAAAMLGIVPQGSVVCDRVDMLELNRVYNDLGEPTLTQMIFWDWHERDAQLHVVAWRSWPDDGPRPTRTWPSGDYVLLWHDGEVLREVHSTTWRESWTQFDPELADRRLFSKSARRGLTRGGFDLKWSASQAPDH